MFHQPILVPTSPGWCLPVHFQLQMPLDRTTTNQSDEPNRHRPGRMEICLKGREAKLICKAVNHELITFTCILGYITTRQRKTFSFKLRLMEMGYLGPVLVPILESKKILVCGYKTPVTKICDGGRISYIFTNFFPNIRALNSKHFTY